MDDGAISAAPNQALDQRVFGMGQRSAGGPAARSTRKALLAIVVVLVVVAVPVTSAVILSPSAAEQVQAFGGTVIINNTSGDTFQAVEMDLATGEPTLGLNYAYQDVSAPSTGQLDVLPLSSGSLFLNTQNGDVNFLDSGNVLVNQDETTGQAVPGQASDGAAWAVADGSGAFVVRTGDTTTISHVVPGDLEARAQRIPSSELDAPAPEDGDGQVPATVADGDLWIRTGGASDGSLQQINVVTPGASSAAHLEVRRNVARCEAPCQLNSGTSDSGSTFVALASRNSIRVISGNGGTSTAEPFGNVMSIVAVGNSGNDALFAIQNTTGGWALTGIASNGSLISPVPLTHLNASTLVRPVMDNGNIYALADEPGSAIDMVSIDPSTGTVTRIDPYPTDPGGIPDFESDQVVAIGPRVIFNDPSMLRGVTLFTDGSKPPVIFKKTGLQGRNPSQAPGGTAVKKVVPKPAAPTLANQPQKTPPSDDEAPCSGSGLTAGPHRPESLTKVSVSPHSMTVSWAYPLVALSDCIPQSWIIAANPTGGSGAGSSPVIDAFDDALTGTGASVAGQTAVAGLQSDTTYTLTIAAQLNGKSSAASQPLVAATPTRGPDAPTITRVTAADGSWSLSWTPCSGNCPDNETVSSWVVSWSGCGGSSGVVAIDAGQSPINDPSVRSFSLPVSPTDPAGAGLAFRVWGVANGVDGDPSSAGACITAWDGGNAAAFSVNPQVSDPGSTSQPVNVQAQLVTTEPGQSTLDEVTDFGYTGGSVVFTVQPPSGPSLSQSASWSAGSPLPEATVSGVPRMIGQYTVDATISIDPANDRISQGTTTPYTFSVSDPSIVTSGGTVIPQGQVGQTTSFTLAATGGTASGDGSPGYQWTLLGSVPSTLSSWSVSPSGSVSFVPTVPFPQATPLQLTFTVTAGGATSAAATFIYTAIRQASISAIPPQTVIASGSDITVPSGTQETQGQMTVNATLSIPTSSDPGAESTPSGGLTAAVNGGSPSPCGALGAGTPAAQDVNWTATCTVDTSGLAPGSYAVAVSYGGDPLTMTASSSANFDVFGSTMILADCTSGVTCSDALTASGGQGADTWQFSSSKQDADGLSITQDASGDWQLSGIPAKAEASISLTFVVTDEANDTFDYATTLTVDAQAGSGGGGGGTGGTGNSGGVGSGAVSQSVTSRLLNRWTLPTLPSSPSTHLSITQ
jgi:hypothetical protein